MIYISDHNHSKLSIRPHDNDGSRHVELQIDSGRGSGYQHQEIMSRSHLKKMIDAGWEIYDRSEDNISRKIHEGICLATHNNNDLRFYLRIEIDAFLFYVSREMLEYFLDQLWDLYKTL